MLVKIIDILTIIIFVAVLIFFLIEQSPVNEGLFKHFLANLYGF